MNPQAKATRMSAEQIIAQFAERLHEEYTKAEVAQQVVATNQNDDTSADQSETKSVAAWDGESPLSDSEFVRVSCRKLSASGISFLVGHPPTTPYFVVVFETNDETVFIKARVSDAKPDVTMGSESYLVNTEFDGRVESEYLPALAANT